MAPDGCALACGMPFLPLTKALLRELEAVELWRRLGAALLREVEAVRLWGRLGAALLKEFARDADFWWRRIRWAQLHDAASGGYHLQ